MGNREQILGRIREALSSGKRRMPPSPTTGFDRVLPAVPESFAERLELFKQQSEALRTKLIVAEDLDIARREFGQLAKTDGWTRIALQPTPSIQFFLQDLDVDLERLELSEQTTTAELEPVAAGITACDCLVAQTGGILISALSAGGRALSVLPPHHVVIAKRSQLVADLPAALALAAERYKPKWPSYIGFITGPSRTGDIERILVLGAHGPRKLTVLLLPDDYDRSSS
ncbi:MAG: LUD domain-containing protein [Verrucomicrobia bacterium]|nr:LUD domain-containing protein [Verrucomicrobiota bacterium]